MRALFFNAVAEHPKIAWPLQEQVEATLRPFDRYLQQAIEAAKSRQFRYRLPWRRVLELRHLDLEPLDTRLVVPRQTPGWVVLNWPAGKLPEMGRPLMILNRDAQIRVESCEPGALGMVIRPVETLHVDDEVVWCGVRCSLAREPDARC